MLLLIASLFLNLSQLIAFRDYSSAADPPHEKFHSGDLAASDKIARLDFSGVIMPPYTGRWLKAIEAATKDDKVKGVLMVIDSPGGLVADSHELYHRIKLLREKKPMVIAMKRLAASGGYYIAMGGGPETKIFAEPTTWTGSIGVIMPRYNAAELAKTWGVKSEPLVTGPLKNTLDPLHEMGDEEKEVWGKILDDAFVRFKTVIKDGRGKLSMEQIQALATGQVYTSGQALENGLVDVIGYEEDALQSLKDQLNLTSVRVIKYETPVGVLDLLTGNAQARQHQAGAFDPLERLWEASVPRALYLFGWTPGMADGK
jgi:protease-4